MTLEIVTLLMIITGSVIIGITYYNIKKENAKNVSIQMNINEAGFDEYHNELNETALDIYKELDNKYQEILVIYELIEKKYTEVKNGSKNNFVNNFNESVGAGSNLNNVQNSLQNSQNNTGLTQYDYIQENTKNLKHNTKPVTNYVDFTQPKKEANQNRDHNIDHNFDDDNLAMRLLNEQLKEEKANNKNNRHSDVIELLNKGFNVEQIARELSIGTGEVLFVKELLKVKNEQK